MRVHSNFKPGLPKNVKQSLSKTLSKLNSFRSDDFVIDELFRPSTHLLNRKGKLLRPALVFLSAQALREDSLKFVDLAAAIELLHVSSLVHDDIIDKELFRRGKRAVNVVCGNEIAILAGDALISKAIQLSSKYGKEVLYSISSAALEMCAGELLDYGSQRSNTKPDVRKYLEIARLKTASLLGTSCSIVSVYKRSPATKELYNYGVNLGMAFQIRDDILDFMEPDGRAKNKTEAEANIVELIRQKHGVGTKEALQKAAGLNRSYIRQAIDELRNKRISKLLEPYARMIGVDLKG